MRILLVEDDKKISSYLVQGLAKHGHAVDAVGDGQDGLLLGLREPYDLAIIDRLLPGLDGLSLLKGIRVTGRQFPVLLLTSMGRVSDKVEGLDAGADDYMMKPFSFAELLARVNALDRRGRIPQVKTALRVADLELDIESRIVTRGAQVIDLLPREFAILHYLVKNKGRIITKNMILENIWNINFNPESSIVETHISRLRAKIDKPFQEPLIHTKRNIGYSIYESR
jgi:two-component system OmpR family response regulator